MLKSLNEHSSNTFLGTPQVDGSVNNCLIPGQSFPLELGKFVAKVIEEKLGIEGSTVGERVLFLACHSMFIPYHLL